jgi:hypothetical protein
MMLLPAAAEAMKECVLECTFLSGVADAAMETLLRAGSIVPIFGEVCMCVCVCHSVGRHLSYLLHSQIRITFCQSLCTHVVQRTWSTFLSLPVYLTGVQIACRHQGVRRRLHRN